jgi:polar amino acid transport system permease protein
MPNFSLQFWHVWPHLDALFQGALLTIALTAQASAFGLVASLVGAYALMSGFKPAATLARAYVEVIRNTPFLVQLLFIYFSLPSIGIQVTANQAALMTMIMNFTGYTIEILRGGIQSIPATQLDSARSIGFSKVQTFIFVVAPQAVRNTYPSLTSQFSLLLLGSSVVSAISAEDLTAAANYIQSLNFRSFEVYLVTAGFYLALTALCRITFAAIWRMTFHRWE